MSTSHGDDSNEFDAGRMPPSEHFDELDAVRRFPSEDAWLDLPMPDLLAGDPNAIEQVGQPEEAMDSRSFADRVLRARQAERQLDTDLNDLDGTFPAELLTQFAAPTPSSTFVDRTTTQVMQERRQRWQEMLARHVAPEPSTVFVSRTLAALRNELDGKGGSRSQNQRAAGGIAVGYTPDHNTARRGANRNWPVFGLVAAAAAALFWLAWTGDARPPLELRLANQASPAVAYSDSTTPMSAILAHIAHDEEPSALFDVPADGLWLTNSYLPDAGGLR